ncbi:TPA: pyridoxal-phosphate dependent enzyme [Staphylococcus aureus]|nr:pyridoxal-phosphate dependent enzyme [Staphylococcus aureus]
MRRWQGLVEEFKAHLPVNENTPKLTLNEGNTPLIHCENMSKILGIDLYVKYEGANPTGSFEIVQQLDGEAPDILAIPVGNAGNITAYWKGFKEYHEAKGSQLPKMFGFQAEGASPIVQNKVIKNPETIATAIRIGNPASWDKATNALKESNGLIDSVTDDEILEAYQLMTTKEGVFSEPASNASIAGLIKLHRQGKLPQGKKVVAILTGNGLKDPDPAISLLDNPIKPLPNDKDSIIDYIKGAL